MSWMKKIREIREKNLAKKKEIKTGAEADGGSEAPQLPSHAPDNKVDLTATPEKDKRLNPIFLYGGGGLFLIILCAVMFSSCFHDDRGDRRKPSAMTVQGDVLNDQSVQQIEMKNLKQMNDEAQANAKGGKKNAQDGKTKPTKEENTVVEKKTARSSAGASSAKRKRKKSSHLLSNTVLTRRPHGTSGRSTMRPRHTAKTRKQNAAPSSLISAVPIRTRRLRREMPGRKVQQTVITMMFFRRTETAITSRSWGGEIR